MDGRMNNKSSPATAYLQCNKGNKFPALSHSGVIVMLPQTDPHHPSGGVMCSLHQSNQVERADSTIGVRQVIKARMRECTDKTGPTRRLRRMFSTGESTVYPIILAI